MVLTLTVLVLAILILIVTALLLIVTVLWKLLVLVQDTSFTVSVLCSVRVAAVTGFGINGTSSDADDYSG